MDASDLHLDGVRAAAARIRGVVHQTPVATCSTLDRLAGRRLFFKCEHLQKAGAFKFRGAAHAIATLPAEQAKHGVVTHSSGNHAGALALAARLRGIPAHIVMPRTASAIKQRAVAEYGGRILLCEPTQAAREATAAQVMAETGATLVHPYDDARVILGQGTALLELLEQVEGLEAVIVPVGGGGLAGGTCLAAEAARPAPRIFAAEPAGADDAARSFAAGTRLPQLGPNTIADGLLTSLGQLTWPILHRRLAEVITVSDTEIVAAMRLAWERAKLLIEPSAATVLAAVLGQRFRSLDGLSRVGLILSGGNVDLDHLPWR